MMWYRQKGDWAIAFACNLMRAGLGDPRWTPQEVLLPQLADETPAERLTRAEIMPSGAGSANRRAIIVNYARYIATPPRRRRPSRPPGDRFDLLRSASRRVAWIGAHRVRAKRGPMAGSGVTRLFTIGERQDTICKF